MTKPNTLETRIGAILSADSVASSDINALIAETLASIEASEITAAEARAQAYDPALSPDPKAARERLEDTLFTVSRLKTLLPRLEALADQTKIREQAAAYTTARDALQIEADALEAELTETYRTCAVQIATAFANAMAFTEHARQQLPALPAGIQPFRKFDDALVRTMERVVLVGSDGRQPLWPVKSNFSASYAQSMSAPPHPGANWGSPAERERRREIGEQQARENAAYHKAAAKAEEDRVNAEQRERAAMHRRTA